MGQTRTVGGGLRVALDPLQQHSRLATEINALETRVFDPFPVLRTNNCAAAQSDDVVCEPASGGNGVGFEIAEFRLAILCEDPTAATTISSVSINFSHNRSASFRPIVVLPLPRYPIRKTLID